MVESQLQSVIRTSHILPVFEHPNFMKVFTRKRHLSDPHYSIPVHVIRNPKAALLGAACYVLVPSHETTTNR
jgi:glucokinase